MKKSFELQLFATTVKLTAGADNYTNRNDEVKILALGGNDSIYNGGLFGGDKVTIDGGTGNDTIESDFANDVSLFGGAGNDLISNGFGHNVTISGGAGNDSINSGNYTTVIGGKGNDSISLYVTHNNVVRYAKGDGNDIIGGFCSNDTLNITKGSYSTMVSGNDFIVTVGKQKITLEGAVGNEHDKVIIKDSSGTIHVYNDWKVWNGTSGDDYISNYANNVTVNGGKGNDKIYSTGSNVSISGGAGNDEITGYIGSHMTIDGGKGNDAIEGGDYSTIDGGKGNDAIEGGDYSTIIGGKGNDTIDAFSDNIVVRYASGDGNDIVKYFRSDDILHITKGSYKVKTSGDDVIVTVGKGKITLKDAADSSITIKDSSGKVTTKNFSSNIAELFAEDNLSEIVAEKPVAEFENTGEKVTQENLITFAE